MVIRNGTKDVSGTAGSARFKVQRGPLTISVMESGTIQNREKAIVKSAVEGRTTILTLIPEGARVTKGQLMVELDSSKLNDDMAVQQIVVQNAEASFIRARENQVVVKSQGESDVTKAEQDVKFAQLDLKKYEEGEYPQELQQAQNEITLANEDLQRAADKLVWSKRLADEGFITRSELQGDELAYKRYQLNLELAKGKLALLQDYTHKRKLEELNSNVEQTTKALDRVKRKTSSDNVQAEADLKAKESEFQRQQAKLEKTKIQIAKCKIVAPVDGMVVYATTGKMGWRGNADPLGEGREVREREELIYLPTTDSMMAEIKVHESSLKKVATGMAARIHVDALPDKDYNGTVGKIGLLPDATTAFLNPDLKVYATEVYLDEAASELRAGMTCRVEVIVKQLQDVLYVPVQCVVQMDSRHVVYVPGLNGPQQREVQIGMDNSKMIHIVSGLTEGDNVLLSPPLHQTSQDHQAPASQPASRPGDSAATDRIAQSSPADSQPASAPEIDIGKLRSMTPEERKAFLDTLPPEKREAVQKQLRPRQRPPGQPARPPGGQE
ncbi:MAG: HlyD family efflux transporter periplasmic adaptor subunit [Planctomycetes bacterium]|nr:HlyD family efflux transporter periplasmic adaptor subunit [Planctomycetota bacterium]